MGGNVATEAISGSLALILDRWEGREGFRWVALSGPPRGRCLIELDPRAEHTGAMMANGEPIPQNSPFPRWPAPAPPTLRRLNIFCFTIVGRTIYKR